MRGPFARVPGAVADETRTAPPRQPARRAARARRRARGRAARRPRACSPSPARTGCRGWTRSRRRRSRALAPGESTELLVLDPHGHVEHAASVLDDGETTWLIVDRGDAEGLLVVAAQDALPAAGRPARRERGVRRRRRHARRARGRRSPPRPPACRWCGPIRGRGVAAGGHAYARGRAAPRRRARLGRGDRHARRGGADRGCRGRGRARTRRARRGRCAAHRRLAPALGERGRRARAAARARLAAHRRAPREGLLPRPGDRREGAQPRSPAAAPRRAAARRQRLACCPPAATRCSSGENAVGVVTSAALPLRGGPDRARRRAPQHAGRRRAHRPTPPTATIVAAQEVIVPPEAGATANIPRLPRLGRRAG